MVRQAKFSLQVALLVAIGLALAPWGVAAQGAGSISDRYGSRPPRTCANASAPANGAISSAQALNYLNCQMEYVAGGGDLYLVENVRVQVGAGIPYAAIREQRSLEEIDVRYPVYPIRGSLVRYQCQDRITAARVATANCSTYSEPNATGYCYKTAFGDWKCYMNDPQAMSPQNVRHDVPPPKGSNPVATTAKPANPTAIASAGQRPGANQPRPTAPAPKIQTTPQRNEDGFVTPDFSEMEKYFDIVKYEYNPLDGRVKFVVKAKRETNIFRWYLSAYDSDGVKISDTSFNGNVVSPTVGELTRIYTFAPNERDIGKVARIGISRKLD